MEMQRNFEDLIATQYNDNGKFGKLLQFRTTSVNWDFLLIPRFNIIIIDPVLIFLDLTI